MTWCRWTNRTARWDPELIDEGMELVKMALAGPALGPYLLQAAIAATHADAATAEDTDWAQVHALYLILERIAPNPMVTLNRAVALSEIEDPQAGLDLLATLDRLTSGWPDITGCLSVRAHLLEKTATWLERTNTTGAPPDRQPASPSNASWSPGPAG